jgi:hypothetical protein
MPELSLLLNSNDECSLITLLFEKGARLVADLRYDSPEYFPIRDWSKYSKARANARLFFVLFDSYEECPLKMELIRGGCFEGKYAIMQRTGGPTIDFLASVQYRKDDCDRISDGMIGYHRTYRNTITTEMEEVPKELVTIYRDVAKVLKTNYKTIKSHGSRTYLIGPHAYQLVKNGTLKLGVEGLELPE